MKTVKLLFASIIILGLGFTSSYAGSKIEEMGKEESALQVAFLSQNIDQMVVSFESTGENVELNLLNENGQNIHTEAVSGTGVFSKRYDFSELEKGIYSFQVKTGNEELVKTVVLK